MENLKPTVIVSCYREDENMLKDILAGLEEEGVFYSIEKLNSNFDLALLARNAALKSALGVGIGIAFNEVCVQFKNLDIDKPLFAEKGGDGKAFRRLGCNVARFVKGMPLR